jgi:adenylate cyclase
MERPDDAERAAACAVAMQLAMQGVNEGNRREGLPEVQMGVALNTGEVVVGNIGSQKRAKYGVVGSHVNLTGRIESYTVGGQILVSQYTVEKAGAVLDVGERRSFQTKGFQDPITVFDLHGVAGAHGLHLPERREPLVPLRPPLPVSFTVVEGKRIGGAAFHGGLVKASRSAAELDCAEPVEPLSNLLIRLPGRDGDDGGDLYAKVVGAGEGPRSVLVRFTSSSPETSRILEEAMRRAGEAVEPTSDP